MKKILIRGYIRAFTETEATVADDFDLEDGESVQIAFNEQGDIGDIVVLEECSLDAEWFDNQGPEIGV